MREDDCVVAVVADNPFGRKGELFLVGRKGLGKLTARRPNAYVNLTPSAVGKTFKGGPAGAHERPSTLVRQSHCPNCADSKVRGLLPRFTPCLTCGDSKIVLRLA